MPNTAPDKYMLDSQQYHVIHMRTCFWLISIYRFASGMQAQQEMNRVLCDVQTLQMKNQQELFTLLQSRLERVSY